MTRIIRAELFRLRRSPGTWVLMYVLIGIIVLMNVLLRLMSTAMSARPDLPAGMGNLRTLLGLPLSIPFALTMLTTFGAVLAVILVASSVGNEYTWRTIRIALISGEGRLKFLGGKLIAAGIVILIGMVVGLATGFAIGLATTAIGGDPIDFSFATSGYLWDQFLQFWRTFFAILPITLLGSLLALLGRSAMSGIAVGIGVMFLEPIVTSLMGSAGGWVAEIPNYLFNANVNSINGLNKLPIPGGFSGGMLGASFQTPSTTHAFTVLSVYIVVFIGVAFLLFRKRDVTG